MCVLKRLLDVNGDVNWESPVCPPLGQCFSAEQPAYFGYRRGNADAGELVWVEVEVVLIDDASDFGGQIKESREFLIFLEKLDELLTAAPISKFGRNRIEGKVRSPSFTYSDASGQGLSFLFRAN